MHVADISSRYDGYSSGGTLSSSYNETHGYCWFYKCCIWQYIWARVLRPVKVVGTVKSVRSVKAMMAVIEPMAVLANKAVAAGTGAEAAMAAQVAY